MLTNTLNTNEIKNAASTEVEFQSLQLNGRSREFGAITEQPALPHRLTIKHQEVGAGLKARRRSLVRIDKTVVSTVDNVTPVTVSAYIVLDAPTGALLANTEMANALAEVGSFTFLNGADSTFLYNGTGNGAQALLTGGI